MKEGFQELPLCGTFFVIGENVLRNCRTVDFAGGCQDGVTPALAERFANLGIFGEDGVACAIGIQDWLRQARRAFD